MEIFKNRNNFAGNSFQLVVMSTGVAAIPAEMPFIVWLQFNRVKWILRKVEGVVFLKFLWGGFLASGREWLSLIVKRKPPKKTT